MRNISWDLGKVFYSNVEGNIKATPNSKIAFNFDLNTKSGIFLSRTNAF